MSRPKENVGLAIYGILIILACLTLSGKILLATLVFLVGFAVKTWLLRWRNPE